MAKLKVGIAGYGIVGRRRKDFIDKHENLQATAVCDIRFEEGHKEDDLNCYKTYTDLLEKEDLDILFVCMPNDIAPEVTIAGLNKDLHVFCEKPPGRTVGDIKKVVEAWEKKKHLKLKYGFNHRFHDSIQEAHDIIKSGKLGKVLNLRGVYGKASISPWNEPEVKHWRTSRKLAGGGILLDQGIHMVDLMRFFGGEFDDVKSFVSNDFWKLEVEDNAYALMRNKHGVHALLHSSATQWRHRFSLEIHLEKGNINLVGILSGSKSYGRESMTVVERNPVDGGNTKEVTTTYIEDPSWWKEICEFYDCISQNQEVRTGSCYEALATMQLVYKIYCADEEWKNKWNISME